MTAATLYCSQCHWSTTKPWTYPPRWYCLLTGKPLVRDEDVCKNYVKLTIQPIKQGAEREI